ncbi:MAG: hypothetical protein AB7K24_04510 [Gemmataceae bacterium]
MSNEKRGTVYGRSGEVVHFLGSKSLGSLMRALTKEPFGDVAVEAQNLKARWEALFFQDAIEPRTSNLLAGAE